MLLLAAVFVLAGVAWLILGPHAPAPTEVTHGPDAKSPSEAMPELASTAAPVRASTPTAGEPEPAAAVRETTRVVTVRALASGEVVADAAFTAVKGASERAVRTGDDGSLELAAAEVLRAADGASWRLVVAPDDGAAAARTVWAYQLCRVRGVVRGWPEDDALDMGSVTLHTRWAPSASPGVKGDMVATRTHRWSRQHGLFSMQVESVISEDGAFVAHVASLPGLILRALAPGWRPASEVVPLGPAVDGLELQLRRSLRLRGKIIDADGKPVAGASVEIFATREFPPDFDPLQAHLLVGGSEGMTVVGSSERVTVITSRSVHTRADGRFVGRVAGGRFHVMVHAKGYRSRMASVSRTEGGDAEFELRLEEADGQSVRFTKGGARLAGWSLYISDVTDSTKDRANPQPTIEVVLAAASEVPDRYFAAGRRYMIRLRPPAEPGEAVSSLPTRFIRWTGETHIDYDQLTDTRIY